MTDMIRTSVYLDQQSYQYVQGQSEQSGKTLSDVIRDLIRQTMRQDAQKILDAVNGVYGLWEDREMDVDEYIRNMRRDRVYDYD